MPSRAERTHEFVMIVALAAFVAGPGVAPVGFSQDSPASQPSTQPQLDPRVDAILRNIEQQRVRDLQATIAWQQRDVRDLPEDVVTKRGMLWYRDGLPVAKFMIHFTDKIVGTERRTLDERYLFDGEWWVEVQSRTRSVIRRQVRRPDDPRNPYRLGEGPFPLPFGQKREDILREFTVELRPAAKDDPPETDHLELTPREGTQSSQDFRKLHFWVSRRDELSGLPLKVQVAKLDGTGRVSSHLTISFSEPKLNAGIPDERFVVRTPPGFTEEPPEYLDPRPGEPAPSGQPGAGTP